MRDPKDFDPDHEYIGFNGDVRKKGNPDRVNGSADWEDRGFDGEVELVKAPERPPQMIWKNGRLVPAPTKDLDKANRGQIQPIPEGHRFQVAMRPDMAPIRNNHAMVYSPYSKPPKAQKAPEARDMTPRQKRQVKKKP